jgi:hypothetical protein
VARKAKSKHGILVVGGGWQLLQNEKNLIINQILFSLKVPC